jgi:ribosome-associated protein
LSRKKSGAKTSASHKSRRETSRGEAAKRKSSGGSGGPRRKPGRIEGSVDLVTRTRSLADTRRHQESKTAAEAAIGAALDKKALLPVLLDVSERASYTDFIGIVSGRSDRQVDAIAENVIHAMAEQGWRLIGREGNGNGRWTLLDFGDVVLHVFYHPVREFYDIESLWIDAPRVSLKVPPEATQFQEETLFYDRP